MKDARKLLILGTWVAILPFLGIPYSWQDVLVFLTGLVLLFLSYSKYKKDTKKPGKEFDSFRENFDFKEDTQEKDKDSNSLE
jgi:hypothetical protein